MKKNPPKPVVPLPEQPPGMSARDYARLVAYILAPAATRSVEAVFRAEGGTKGAKGENRRPPGSFYRAVERWGFKEHAAGYDRAVAALEAAELEAIRKQARKDRAALVQKFVSAASALLDQASIAASTPAGCSAFVVRSLIASRQELEPQEHRGAGSQDGLGRGLPPSAFDRPALEFWVDGGDGVPRPLATIPEPDDVDPTFDALSGASLPDLKNDADSGSSSPTSK